MGCYDHMPGKSALLFRVDYKLSQLTYSEQQFTFSCKPGTVYLPWSSGAVVMSTDPVARCPGSRAHSTLQGNTPAPGLALGKSKVSDSARRKGTGSPVQTMTLKKAGL